MRMRFIIFSILFSEILSEIYYGYAPEFLSVFFPESPDGINYEEADTSCSGFFMEK